MKIHIETYGCTVNRADSKIIEGQLKEFKLTNYENSHIVILNTCGVKNSTESRMIFRIEKCLKDGKKVIVSGCLPKINKALVERYPVAVVDLNSYDRLVEAVNRIDENPKFYSDEHRNKIVFDHTLFKEGEAVAEISEGCLGNCHYCGTKHARGDLTSYPLKDIVNYISKLVKKGKKKILLTSQDTGCYGRDIDVTLVDLLEAINQIEGQFKVRVGMMNPRFCYEMLDALIEQFKSDKLMKFLHIPVQSGSNKVLKEMNRPYKVDIFKKIIKKFRAEIPGIYISTDIIVGFPTETEEDFERTLNLMREVKPDKINISKFYPRPNTKAKEMKQLPTQVKKKRSVALNKLLNSLK